MTNLSSGNLPVKYGNSGLYSIKHIIGFLLSGTSLAKPDTVVVSTHGIVKKADKIPKKEIEKTEKLRLQYFEQKTQKQ